MERECLELESVKTHSTNKQGGRGYHHTEPAHFPTRVKAPLDFPSASVVIDRLIGRPFQTFMSHRIDGTSG